jgi:hypothetical protein
VSAGSDAAWLSASVSGSTVTVAAALGALTAGDHTGHVTLTNASAVNSPVSIPVTFTVQQPTISATPAALSFAAQVSATTPAKTIAVGNSGTGTLGTVTATPTYTSGTGWLNASVTGTGNSQTVSVTATAPGTAGTYQGTIELAWTGASNTPVSVPVTLVVTATAPATLAATPASLSFTTTAGTNPASKTIAISNSGGGTLATVTATPSYTTGSGWMSASVTGSGNAYTVTVSITAPAAGTYQGAISVVSAGATNTPLSVPVTLTVSAPSGGTTTASGGGAAIGDALFAKDQSCSKVSNYYISMYRSYWDQHVAGVSAAVSAGRMSYSKSQADACTAAINAATCTDFESTAGPTSCAQWVVGLVTVGNDCYGADECANGWCDSGASVCPGTCTAFTAHGAPCITNSDECGPGYVCDNGSSTCVAETYGAVGQPCGNSGCAAGLFCSSANTCTARRAAGASCTGTTSEECQVGLTCDPVGYTCKTLVGAGQSCATGVCGDGLYCSATGTICKEPALAGQDCTDPASRLGDPLNCVDGSLCLGSATKVCTNGTAGAGATCAASPTAATPAAQICAPNSYCGGAGSTCVAYPTQPPSACYL